jgi:phosphoserine phosphatase
VLLPHLASFKPIEETKRPVYPPGPRQAQDYRVIDGLFSIAPGRIKTPMELVATLISAPDRPRLTAKKVAAAARSISEAGGEADTPKWLADDLACDIHFGGLDLAAARTLARGIVAEEEFDLVVQPRKGRRKQLLIADMDATIVTGETLDELAAHAGLKEEISAITARAMRGEIDFKTALRERVDKLKGLPVDALSETLAATKLTAGARTLVQTMRAHDAYTVLVSGGFRFFTRAIASQVGFHEDQANDFIIEDDRLSGKVVEPILDKEAKLTALQDYANQRALPLSATLATGDGANDLPMITAAGLGVAFHAKPMVEAEAPASIRWGDLTALLYLQGYSKPEFHN